MTQLTLMESSFSCFPHCCSIFFFLDKTRVHLSCWCTVPSSPLCPGKQGFRRHLGNVPSPMEKEAPMGFFKLLQGLSEVCYYFCPHLSLTTLESSWAQNPAQEGWTQVLWESQCSVCLLRENNSVCHKTWNFLIVSNFRGNPTEPWMAKGYFGHRNIFPQAVVIKWMEVLVLLFWSWYYTLYYYILLLEFACAKQQSIISFWLCFRR